MVFFLHYFSEMMDVTTPTGMMVENMEYMPDIVPAMLNLMNREDTVSLDHTFDDKSRIIFFYFLMRTYVMTL